MAAVKIKFLPTMNMYRAGEDAAQYAKDALAAGLVSMGRFDVPVVHMDGSRRLGEYDSVKTVTVRAVETANAYAAGEPVRLEAGQVYQLRVAAAAELVSIGFVVIVPEIEQPETAMLETPERAVMPKAKSKRARK